MLCIFYMKENYHKFININICISLDKSQSLHIDQHTTDIQPQPHILPVPAVPQKTIIIGLSVTSRSLYQLPFPFFLVISSQAGLNGDYL